MFELETTRARLVHINPRTEKHGDQDVPAADVRIQVIQGNGILALFAPTLRNSLYETDTSDGQLEGVEALTKLRYPGLIERLRLNTKLTGAEVVIGFGLGDSSDINLDTVDVDGFAVELMEGGSVSLTFRVKTTATGEQIKKLYEVLGGEIDITVTPPVDPQGSLLGGGDD